MRDPVKEAGKWVERTRPARKAMAKREEEARKKAEVNKAANKYKWSK